MPIFFSMLNRHICKGFFVRDTKVCSKLFWNADIFVFKILLHDNKIVSAVFLLIRNIRVRQMKEFLQ